jgi:hypothetical protein
MLSFHKVLHQLTREMSERQLSHEEPEKLLHHPHVVRLRFQHLLSRQIHKLSREIHVAVHGTVCNALNVHHLLQYPRVETVLWMVRERQNVATSHPSVMMGDAAAADGYSARRELQHRIVVMNDQLDRPAGRVEVPPRFLSQVSRANGGLVPERVASD